MPYSYVKTTNIAYGPNAAHRLDRYKPTNVPGQSKYDTVLMVPGGGWQEADRTKFDSQCRTLAGLGYVAFTMSYGITPAYTYPSQIDDVQLAVDWVKAQTYTRPQHFCAWGRSAGSYMVAHMANRGAVTAAIMECGPYDLTTLLADPAVPPMLNGADAHDASPLFGITAATKPNLVVHGTADVRIPYAQSVDWEAACDALAVPSTLILHSGDHGKLPETPEGAAVFQSELAFLAANI